MSAQATEPRRNEPPERLNLADHFLDARVREGDGDRRALLTDDGSLTYREVQALANRTGNLLLAAGVEPEQRVLIALRDGPELVAALFGIVKIGAVAVMLNSDLQPDAIRYFFELSRAKALLVDAGVVEAFREVARPRGGARRWRWPERFLVVGETSFEAELQSASDELECFDSHRDDAAIWLFSGGTTGRPKAVVQTHRSFAYTTECYAKGVIGYGRDDVTISVPKLFFGYATGSNLLFPFAVGATAVLFPGRCTPEALFERIERHRPTILVNVPTMVAKMLDHPGAADRDLSSLRLSTSAGEALPVDLHRRWDETFGVELLDGLGTAEQWHIFLTNRPGEVRPGTLGKVVPGFEARVCDDDGRELPTGEVGRLRVRGGARAIGYWQRMDETQETFQGEWTVTGDMLSRDEEGVFTYHGRGDDMLKVSGKWLSPGEVEDCLLAHPAVAEVAVVGVEQEGLIKPWAFVVHRGAAAAGGELEAELQAWVRERLEPYKYPRRVVFLDELPRTHLGKVDRGRLRTSAVASR